MSRIEQELKTNTDRIKRLRNQLPIHSHRIKQLEEEAAVCARLWMIDYKALSAALEQQNDQLFRLLTCGLSHRRVMKILRRLEC